SENCRLENIKRVINFRQLSKSHVEPTQQNHHCSARQDEGESGKYSAPHSALEVTDVDRKLQCLRSRQHVTEGHNLHEAILCQPSTLLDHVIEHHGDLRDWTTDVHEAEEQKIQKHLAPGRHLVSVVAQCFAFPRFRHRHFLREVFRLVGALRRLFPDGLLNNLNNPSKITLACCSRLRSSGNVSLNPSTSALTPAASSR